MRILIACEFSGIVRDAFIAKGHDAISCDLLPTERPGPHIVGDVLAVLDDGWDMMIAHPPCTHIAVSGAAWFKQKRADGRQQAAIEFFMAFANANIPLMAIENPVCIMSTQWRKPDQIIQPYEYGHKARKATCLWLKGLPKLTPTNIVEPKLYTDRKGRTYSKDFVFDENGKWTRFRRQGKRRSVTYQGIADAMAEQWGKE